MHTARQGAFSACSPPAFLLLEIDALTSCFERASLHTHARLSGLVAHSKEEQEQQQEEESRWCE